MADKEKIIIHQTLHGYKQGHSLLASSVELSPIEKRSLLLLSDYAGSGIEKFFTEYITGYPLQQSNYFALAKTWYAEEMPRPGCVWTQTLLIDMSFLWMIQNQEMILQLFERPTHGEFDNYNEPISIRIRELKEISRPADSFNEISCFLYSNDRPLLLLASSASQYEHTILDIWIHQWPRLKRNFSFCTGSVAPRALGNTPFDLQVLPYSRERSLSKTDREIFCVVDGEIDTCTSTWFKSYTSYNSLLVKEFMTQMGSDVNGVASNFRTLFEAFEILHSPSAALSKNYLSFLQNSFHLPEEGKLLKIQIIQQIWNRTSGNKLATLKSFVTDKRYSSLNLDYGELVRAAYKKNDLQAEEVSKALILIAPLLDQNDKLKLANQLPLNLWVKTTDFYLDILDQLLNNDSLNLIEQKEIWQSDIAIQDTWMKHILQRKTTDLQGLIFVLLDTGNEYFIDDLNRSIGEQVFNYLVKWLELRDIPLPKDWQYLIKNNLVAAFKAISESRKLNKSILDLILHSVSPSHQDWNKIAPEKIDNFIRRVIDVKIEPARTGILTYFATASFTNNISSYDTTALLFQPLHNSLEKDVFDPNTWQRFQLVMAKDLYELIELDFYSKYFKDRHEIPDWDRCEYLRRALIWHFIQNKWTFDQLQNVVTDESTFKYIVEFCVEIKPLRKLLKNMFKYIEHTSGKKSFYYEILKKYL